ncbi:unnamed protein product [Oikopleura dioica]|uniref:F5/8 type C domain-containing protein n=1 Tax=Oikopleura dioica TaxID=34765 RepID=E4X0X5_OIKDI|nr:unnamed protein product [Oikopleura dioica]CBY37648.1 unnamed protein product [Oikopleura dioica]
MEDKGNDLLVPEDKRRFSTHEVTKSVRIKKITQSSTLPGYDYTKNDDADYWQTFEVGNEWMRLDFEDSYRIDSIKVRGTGAPDGQNFVRSFNFEYITEGGKIVPYMDGKTFKANTSSDEIIPIDLGDIYCKGLIIYPESTANNIIAMKVWVTFNKGDVA